MVKKVFSSSSQTLHVWAQQTQDEGRCSNIFFERKEVVYSYGYHYPLGFITTNKKGETAAIINTEGYSVTTSKHIGEARGATRHYKQIFLPSTAAMKGLVTAFRLSQARDITKALSNAIVDCINNYNNRLRLDDKKRRAKTLQDWKDSALYECNIYIDLLDWYGHKMNKQAATALRYLTGLNAADSKELAIKAQEKKDKQLRKEQDKRNKEERIIIDLAMSNWVNGIDTFRTESGQHDARKYIHRSSTVLLRVKGEEIQTTQGASFPVAHAIKAFSIISRAAKKGELWQRNGKTIHLGHFQIDRIEPDGTVIAGCHTVMFDEVKRIAKQLKLV